MKHKPVNPYFLILCFSALLIFPGMAFAQLTCPQLFSDHMVLQREIDISVWGWSEPGEKISVALAGSQVKTTADEKGNWKAEIPQKPAGGPYQLIVQGEKEELLFTDVLIGDVWFASGQSNMEHPLAGWPWIPQSQIKGYDLEMKDIDYPGIRLFQVPKMPLPDVAKDFEESDWLLPSQQSLKDFSSTAWFFAKELYEKTGVPIGIIHSSWGGTSIKSWLSPELVNQWNEELDYCPKSLDFNSEVWKKAESTSLENTLKRRLTISFPNEKDLLMSNLEYDDHEWEEISSFNKKMSYDNVGWFRKEVEIPSEEVNESWKLSLGFLNRESRIYINGRELAFFLYPEPAIATIPPGWFRTGKNVITIRLAAPFGVIGLEGDLRDFSLVGSSEKYSVSLAGNWRYQNDRKEGFGAMSTNYNIPTYLYNGMIAPAVEFGIKGFIWYQGEADVARPEMYRKIFPAMIADWRSKWDIGNLPFIYVQLTGIELNSDFGSRSNSWSALREVQKETLKVPATGMVVSIDLGDPFDVHPKNKQEFGRRLALQALNIAYEVPVESDGPKLQKATVQSDTVFLEFSENQIQLVSNSIKEPQSFELAGENGVYYIGKAKQVGNKILVVSEMVKNPQWIRYGWENNPSEFIFGLNGLPVSPFLYKL